MRCVWCWYYSSFRPANSRSTGSWCWTRHHEADLSHVLYLNYPSESLGRRGHNCFVLRLPYFKECGVVLGRSVESLTLMWWRGLSSTSHGVEFNFGREGFYDRLFCALGDISNLFREVRRCIMLCAASDWHPTRECKWRAMNMVRSFKRDDYVFFTYRYCSRCFVESFQHHCQPGSFIARKGLEGRCGPLNQQLQLQHYFMKKEGTV